MAGRPAGATSWTNNPVNMAAHYTAVLIECWLADTPMLEIRGLMGLIGWDGESLLQSFLIEDCWRKREKNRRPTVPIPVKRKLCALAIAHVVKLHQRTQAASPRIAASLRRAQSAADAELRKSRLERC